MPFPNPATHGPDEAALVRTILANHAADLPKLVYADWLEERGDPRGQFLRQFVEATADGSPYPDPTSFPKPWLDLMGVTALIACREHALPIRPAELLSMALPAIRITAERVGDDAIPVGASKFGGGADVPDGFKWPMYGDGLLDFLAQFDLAELALSPATLDLPRSGLMSVFFHAIGDVYSSGDIGGWQVFHFPEPQTLRRTHSDDSTGVSPLACRLSLLETITFSEQWCWSSHTDRVRDAYLETVSNTELGHQFLGYPRFLQGTPGWFRVGNAVRHLLTLDSEPEAGWTWGDTGLLYFGIDGEALRSGSVAATEFEFQCC